MPTINFTKEGKSIEVPDGKNLQEIMKEQKLISGLHVHSFPLKNFCIVELSDAPKIGKRSETEESIIRGNFLFAKKASPNTRLACMVNVNGDMNIATSPTLEKDPVETRARMKFLLAVSSFGILTFAALMYIVFDFVGIM